VVLDPTPSIYELAETYHLLPFVVLFIFVGVLSTLAMAVKACFRFLGEMIESFYDFKVQCNASKRRYEETTTRT
jgi:hypothetical protein